MVTKNPFPGMNPFFEQQWGDAHHMLIAYLRDALQEQLPADLVARTEEEEVITLGPAQRSQTYRPDVTVREPWTFKEPAVATVTPPPASIEPISVFLDEQMHHWLEIREARGRLITVIELLSPSNKLPGDDRERYLRKRRDFIQSGANLVEIDLVRQGTAVFPTPAARLLLETGACYSVAVFRTTRPKQLEVYPICLRNPLPAIRVPLRPTDADVAVDLQPLINQCHERGRYHSLDYRSELIPPLGPDDAAWADSLLRHHQLR